MLLEISNLSVDFGRRRRTALDDICLTMAAGQRIGLIGESGSGKSVTALAIMGLLPETAHLKGSIKLSGQEVVGAADKDMALLRGNVVSMVFQEPMTALDPTMKVGRQVAEVLLLHQGAAAGAARDRVLAMLSNVGLRDVERVSQAYPHQLSGGQRQRVVLAMALINSPQLVICDEPTTALDVTVQARVLKVLDQALTDTAAACLFISHDLAIVSHVCSDIAVMLDGKIVEYGTTAQVLGDPQHPYTKGLVATARLDQVKAGERLPVVEDFFHRDRSQR